MFYAHLKKHIEALLFAAGEPISDTQLAQIIGIEKEHIVLLLAQLIEDMKNEQRGLTILEVAGGYQMCTKPELAGTIAKLAEVQETRLSPAAIETIAIIAFKQPITKQEIEHIRGVKVDGLVNMLVERRLIKEIGRKEAIGRPILYGTTEEFLKCFGLRNLKDLPELPELLSDQP
ncbi:MAG: SMC-Scp complex subunit ScpB [Pelosinus sp.]|nr:SMC-Scp complex subunit ScpB [Pelosinus sp.]